MKGVNNLAWMLLGVFVGSSAFYCISECSSNGGVKNTINKVKKSASNKLNNMMNSN